MKECPLLRYLFKSVDLYFRFKPLFDELQQNDQCCGAYSPLDYNSSWWFKVSNKYVDEYEKLLVNHTNARNMDWDYITKKPLKKLVIPIPLHEHNLTYQRYNDDTNATSTNTYVIKGTTGINKDYKVGREKGINLLIIYTYDRTSEFYKPISVLH